MIDDLIHIVYAGDELQVLVKKVCFALLLLSLSFVRAWFLFLTMM